MSEKEKKELREKIDDTSVKARKIRETLCELYYDPPIHISKRGRCGLCCPLYEISHRAFCEIKISEMLVVDYLKTLV